MRWVFFDNPIVDKNAERSEEFVLKSLSYGLIEIQQITRYKFELAKIANYINHLCQFNHVFVRIQLSG